MSARISPPVRRVARVPLASSISSVEWFKTICEPSASAISTRVCPSVRTLAPGPRFESALAAWYSPPASRISTPVPTSPPAARTMRVM